MNLKGKNVLVAGGTSFIGVNLIERLLKMNCKIKATLHERSPVIKHPSVEYMKCDLTEGASCKEAVKGVDFVFMCAASTAGAAVMTTTPLIQVTPNVLMNTLMLEAAYQEGIKKFIFISSSAAYPDTGSRPTKEEEMFDKDPYDAYFAVGWMKRYAEILCLTYAQKIKKPMPVTVVRPSNIFGPYDKYDFKKSHMLAALIRRVVDRQAPLELWGTGKDIRDLIYIDDFIDGLVLATENDDNYLAVNIASGESYSVKEIIHMIADLDGYKDADIRFDPSKPQTIPVRLVDTEYAKSKIGFTPKLGFKEGLKRTIDWYRNNKDTWDK